MCRVVCFIAFRCSQVSNICVNSCESLSCCQLLQNWKRPRSFVLDWAPQATGFGLVCRPCNICKLMLSWWHHLSHPGHPIHAGHPGHPCHPGHTGQSGQPGHPGQSGHPGQTGHPLQPQIIRTHSFQIYPGHPSHTGHPGHPCQPGHPGHHDYLGHTGHPGHTG